MHASDECAASLNAVSISIKKQYDKKTKNFGKYKKLVVKKD